MNTRSFNRFWPVSWTITHRFGVSEGIPRLTTPTVRLRVVHEHSQFYPILARYVDYYSPFWGIGGNSTIYDPNSAFTCRSTTVTVLTDSGPFRGLLLTVLGYRREFHD